MQGNRIWLTTEDNFFGGTVFIVFWSCQLMMDRRKINPSPFLGGLSKKLENNSVSFSIGD